MAICFQNVGPILYNLWDNERQKMLDGKTVVCLFTLPPGCTSIVSWHRCPVNICLHAESLSFLGKLETQG